MQEPPGTGEKTLFQTAPTGCMSTNFREESRHEL